MADCWSSLARVQLQLNNNVPCNTFHTLVLLAMFKSHMKILMLYFGPNFFHPQPEIRHNFNDLFFPPSFRIGNNIKCNLEKVLQFNNMKWGKGDGTKCDRKTISHGIQRKQVLLQSFRSSSFWKSARREGFCFHVILLRRVTSEPFLFCFLSIVISEEQGNIGKHRSSWFP